MPVAARLVDVVFQVPALLESHRVGVHHRTQHAYRQRYLGDCQHIALAQHDIIVRAGAGECLLQVYAHHIAIPDHHALGRKGVVSLAVQPGHIPRSLADSPLVVVHAAYEPCAAHVCVIRDTSGTPDKIRQTLVLLYQRVASREERFALDRYPPLLHVSRRAAHVHYVVGFKVETLVTTHHQSVLEREGEHPAQVARGRKALRVFQPPGNLDLHRGGPVTESPGLHHEILYRRALRPRVNTRTRHLA